MPKQLRGGPHYGRLIPDTMSHAGASRLAETIREYWARRGHSVVLVVERMRENEDVGTPHDHQVRSNMVGGWPCAAKA